MGEKHPKGGDVQRGGATGLDQAHLRGALPVKATLRSHLPFSLS